ncbi:adenylate kinase [Actinomadura craniellae]|uniref:Adenylate kinase n=1 Tax=Actinomadura craniellae TaxID=2231787 RepID=A0A365H337_9ACTN|nr:adenylate kinase [Actinomadura craniellae]RAY13438.1 adenylate kinase [Actinomadura craniellae]
MQRVLVLGRGGAGKSTLARRLGEVTGLPVVELDALFWEPGLAGTAPERWAAVQQRLVGQDCWILDGDLGPYDHALDVRLRRADTVVLLNFSFPRCAWRAIRRGRERADFWRWVWSYRRRSLPRLTRAIATHAPHADLHLLRDPRAARRFLERSTHDPSASRAPQHPGC